MHGRVRPVPGGGAEGRPRGRADHLPCGVAGDPRQRGEKDRGTLREGGGGGEKEGALVGGEWEEGRGRSRGETQTTAHPAKFPPPPPPPQVDPKVDAMRAQTEKDRKYLQKYALDL